MIQALLLLMILNGFTEKWSIPQGIDGETGRILIDDTDRDGSYEFYMTTYGGSQKVYVYELHLPNSWEVDSFPYYWGPLLWDIGDFDLDGVYDLVIQTAVDTPPLNLISIAESPDLFSYPTQEIWRDTVGTTLVAPICAFDIDRDSKPEICKVLGDYIDLHIYESIGNNVYDKIAEITTASTNNSSSTIAFGDFDRDSLNEFVWGYTGGEYSIWECIGDNTYVEITLQQLPTHNIKDCFSVSDADQDGKWEFIVKGYVVPTAEIHAFIFEATGDDIYEIIQSFALITPTGDYWGGYSDAGDVDGDSIPEIVLEARSYVFILKASGDDSFYIWDTLPGYSTGSNIRVTNDIDGNGLNEIVVSSVSVTKIYEYDGGGIEERTTSCMEPIPVSISPNPFKDHTIIKCHMPGGMDGSLPPVISIQIFDVTGSLVKQLSPAAAYSSMLNVIIWDGTDQIDRKVPPGVYYIVLKSSDKIITKKIVKIQ